MSNGVADNDRGSRDGPMAPPHNTEAERTVCLNLVYAPEVIPDVTRAIKSAEEFYHADCREIFRAVMAVHGRGEEVHYVSVYEELERAGHRWISRPGGALEEICSVPAFAHHAAECAAVVQQKAVLRGVLDTIEAIRRDVFSNRSTADDVLSRARSKLDGIDVDRLSTGSVTVAALLPKVLERMDRRQQGESFGIPSGIADLDKITDGFQKSDLILLAARPSIGKTSLALQICDHVSLTFRVKTLFVSLEMDEDALTERILIGRSGVMGDKVHVGRKLDTEDFERIGRATHEIMTGGEIRILERPSRNIVQIVNEVRAVKAKHDIGMIVVDYIQQIDCDNPRENEVQALTRISKELKNVARTLKVPVLCLSQLNRALESREDKTPRMADLRGSGSLEQDADLVLLLHRPEYFDPTDRPGYAQMIIAKNRNGRTGMIDLVFRGEVMRFHDMAKDVTNRPEEAPY